MSAHFTMTFYWWWVLAYDAVGLILYLPMAEIARRQISPRRTLRQHLRAGFSPAALLAYLFLWPVAVWELFR